MDRYYVSIPDPTPTPEGLHPFRKEQFIDLVRAVLCAFYDDSEIMVCNFLLESNVAHTDQQIAECLGLPQRQVRAVLEARLCKDLITEAEVPNAGVQNGGAQGNPYLGGGAAWYRMNPNVLSATWYRLTQTERAMKDRLHAVQETESYICSRCGGREFDALRAVALYSQTDGLFHCDICEDVLILRENKQIRDEMESLLSQFFRKFESLKERLEAMSKMYIPRPIVIKKTVHEKLLEQGRKDEEARGESRRDFSEFSAAMNHLVTAGPLANRSVPAAAPEWIRQAQSVGASVPTEAFDSSKMEGLFEAKRPKVETKAEVVVTPVEQMDIKTMIESAQNLHKKEEKEEPTRADVRVTVAGVPYSLEEVRSNEALIERMTDQEYTSFDHLIQSLGFR